MVAKISQADLFKQAFRELSKDLNTAIPGYVVAYDPETQLAQIQMGVQDFDRTGELYDPLPIIDCPVQLPGTATHALEFSIPVGTEGLIIFSQRCIDGWENTGQIANNPIQRYHDQHDGMFIPGIRSQPNTLPNVVSDGIGIRNRDTDSRIRINGDGSQELVSPGASIIITAAGDITITANSLNIITPAGGLTHNGTNTGDDHNHLPGTYNIGGTPVVDNSGDPLP